MLTAKDLLSPPIRRNVVSAALIFSIGVLLLLQSKPPYIAIILGAYALTSYRLQILRVPASLVVSLTFVCLLSGGWYLINRGIVTAAIENQVLTPLAIHESYGQNILEWLKCIVLLFAPLSLLGMLFVRASTKTADPDELFLRYLLLSGLPIVLLASARSRYLIIPMLALTVLVAPRISAWLSTFRISSLRLPQLLWVLGGTLFLLFSVLGVRAHREDLLVSTLESHPEVLARNLPVCVDGERRANSPDTIRRTKLLLDYHFNYRPTVFSSIQAATANEFIAVGKCAERIIEEGNHSVEYLRRDAVVATKNTTQLDDKAKVKNS